MGKNILNPLTVSKHPHKHLKYYILNSLMLFLFMLGVCDIIFTLYSIYMSFYFLFLEQIK